MTNASGIAASCLYTSAHRRLAGSYATKAFFAGDTPCELNSGVGSIGIARTPSGTGANDDVGSVASLPLSAQGLDKLDDPFDLQGWDRALESLRARFNHVWEHERESVRVGGGRAETNVGRAITIRS